ncbi:MAG: hypothetical protein QUS35_02825 [bacterium]|nr:hypothetical protein [bacterium]
MKRLLGICVLLLAVAAVPAWPADPSGLWVTRMEGPQGEMALEFEFHVKGDTLTGCNRTDFGETPIRNGKMDGDRFAFDVEFGDMVIHHDCTASADSIVMKVPGMGDGEMKMVLKRKPEKK